MPAAYLGSWHHYGAIMAEPKPKPPPPSPPRVYESKAPPLPTVIGPWPQNDTLDSFDVTLQTTTPAPCLYQMRLANQDIGGILFILFVPVTCIIVILGLLNNTFSYIILRKFNQRSTPNLVMRVLAVADNMVLGSLFFYNTLPATFEYTGHLAGYYEMFQYLKGYLWFFMWFSKTFSVYTIVLMTVDRYIALCHPLKAQSLCTRKKAWIGVVAVIIFSVVYNLPKLWYLKTDFVYDPCSETVKPIVNLTEIYMNNHFKHIYVHGAYFLVMYLLPLHVLLILNIFLVNAIRKASKYRQTISGNAGSRSGKDSVTERIIGVVTAFILLESPSIIANVLITINQWAGGSLMDYEDLHWGARVGYVLSAINSLINFYIYVLVGKRFRVYFVLLFCKDKDSQNDSLNTNNPKSWVSTDRHYTRQLTRTSFANGNNCVLTALLANIKPADEVGKHRHPSSSPQTPRSGSPGRAPCPGTAPPRVLTDSPLISGKDSSSKNNLFFSSQC